MAVLIDVGAAADGVMALSAGGHVAAQTVSAVVFAAVLARCA